VTHLRGDHMEKAKGCCDKDDKTIKSDMTSKHVTEKGKARAEQKVDFLGFFKWFSILLWAMIFCGVGYAHGNQVGPTVAAKARDRTMTGVKHNCCYFGTHCCGGCVVATVSASLMQYLPRSWRCSCCDGVKWWYSVGYHVCFWLGCIGFSFKDCAPAYFAKVESDQPS